ncbi:tryptophan synthase subunit alpha [Candidatus Stoquefichus massiliensis]|uniref:tryptophan synthase subunit alpha n=1 Tax=Candidatus Stoquefichus massiliensis TaxID=1470350 RepID=UPI000486CA91|nr:tryptophan synthase subunit alpha [Candidatus Stoquefichus massiliensis]
MNRIKNAFRNQKAFIAFLTAGDPIPQKTVEYILEMEKAGASLIEIGIPFSDPVAEGPIIQEANLRALKQGITPNQVFDIVQAVRQVSNIPICLMTYLNPVFHYGYERFFQKCQNVGVDGIIIPDCPFEESHEVKDISKKYQVHFIHMIAPTSKERVLQIAKEAQGFIYLVSSMGVTGVRESFSSNLSAIVNTIRSVTDTPVAVGFGIHSPEQVQKISQIADGIIVGSAIVDIIKIYGENAHQPLHQYVKKMIND